MSFGYYCNSQECVQHLHALATRLYERVYYESISEEDETECLDRITEIETVVQTYLKGKNHAL